MKNIIILNSHPIQYYTPFYQKISSELDVNLNLWFCSDNGFNKYYDKEFNKEVKWDMPLLSGLKFEFLKNHSPFSGGVGLPVLGLINLGLIRKLYKAEKSILWVDGWSQISFIIFIFFGKIFGHKICLRAETPLSHELLKNKLYLFFRKIFFYFFLKSFDYYLYIGEENKNFYQYYKCKNSKLVFCPYSVDNNFFENENNKLSEYKNKFKYIFSIPINNKVLLVCGKLIDKKRPLDILKVFKELNNNNLNLIFLGSGPLEEDMRNFIKDNNLKNILITGFVNQSEISKFYTISDVYIMASGVGETWGLATNEAMNFNNCIVVSNLSGCSKDLVMPGENGFIFETSNLNDMKNSILNTLNLKQDIVLSVNKSKLSIFSYNTSIKNISIHLGINYR